MLKYTGHPLVDVGAATLAAWAGVDRPEQVNREKLEEAATYLERQYQVKYLSGYVVCVFPNSAYVNPTAGPEKRQAFLDDHLFAFRREPQEGSPPCGYCGRPAVTIGFRQHVPMLTGEGAINFFSQGRPGLDLCGGCMLSIAAMPLGALRCQGRALLVHSDSEELLYQLAARHLRDHQRKLQLADVKEGEKYPDAKEPRTRLIEELCGWARTALEENEAAALAETRPISVTAYHLTNSGQGPDLTIYQLPCAILRFLVRVQGDRYRRTWSQLVQAAWRLNDREDEAARRNFLYEDLLRLPEGWPRFLRTHFLRKAYRWARKDDPRGQYSLGSDLDLVKWNISELFLKEVVGMDRARVETIRTFADRLAEYMERNPAFWRDFNLARKYSGLRAKLIRASREEQKAGRPPLISFDEYVTIFEFASLHTDAQGESALVNTRGDWNLARDLVLIRVIETLHARGFFKQHQDALEVAAAVERDEDEEAAKAGEDQEG